MTFSAVPVLPMVLALGIPVCLLIIIFLAINQFTDSVSWLFALYIPVLLYSLGRGNFIADVKQYIETSQRGDTVAAAKLIDDLRGNSEADSSDVGDWQALHTQALRVISYRGFERTFAVLFWFFIAGPFGAFLYRLSVIYREVSEPGSKDASLATTWLWLLEMPAVRLMGITWALVGNFDTCPLRNSLLDTQSSSMTVLNSCLRGALGAHTECVPASASEDAADQKEVTEAVDESLDVIEDLTGVVITTHTEPAFSFALVKSSLPLYTRSLLFWVCVIAFSTLIV